MIKSRWVDVAALEAALAPENILFILLSVIGAFVFYKIFLRGVSQRRHHNLGNLFKSLFKLSFVLALCFGTFYFSESFVPQAIFSRAYVFWGLLCLLLGTWLIIGSARIWALELLFYKHMKEGVPALLESLLGATLFVFLSGWILSEIFRVDLTPLLATSAIISVILGFAFQETLGNLVAGIALHLDSPFEIGDWIEVGGSEQSISGQVQEMTWRSTLMLSFTDEKIIIPNRTISQSLVTNFSLDMNPVSKGFAIRLPYAADFSAIDKALKEALEKIPGISNGSAGTLLRDIQNNWILVRVYYGIVDYSQFYTIHSEAIKSTIATLSSMGLSEIPERRLVFKQQES